MPKEPKNSPVNVSDNENFLKFVHQFIRLPLRNGANQIIIHADGKGLIMKTVETKFQTM